MEYPEFLDYIKENIKEELSNYAGFEEAVVDVVSVTKNNSISLDGITIVKGGGNISPTIYLNKYYEEYLEGKSILSIIDDIVSIRIFNEGNIEFEAEAIYDYNKIKENIIVRIINYEKNKNQLEKCPYIPFNDLAITFRWLAHKDDVGIATSLISNSEMERWNISVGELYRTAIENSRRIFPAKITNMKSLFNEYIEECKEYMEYYEEEQIKLYVLTNEIGVNGATSMIYKDILKKFADEKASNLYILPSSIHEVIIVPEVYINDKNYLKEIVKSANKTVVGLMDVLSDTVYYYDRNDNNISIA